MNSRPIRIALTLSLIVAMTTQPLLASGATEQGNDRRGDHQIQCPGCGCCPVQATEARCCCCTGNHSQANDAEADRQRSDDAIAQTKIVAYLPEVAAGCHCGIDRQPMNHRQQRRSSIDEVNLRCTAAQPIGLLFESDQLRLPLRPAWRGQADRPVRYCQQFLCVWRI